MQKAGLGPVYALQICAARRRQYAGGAVWQQKTGRCRLQCAITTIRSNQTTLSAVKLPLLKPGMEDDAVATVQQLLAARGYYTVDCDGIFGELTKRAVMAFQADDGLDADGEVGGDTWTAMLKG